jgi:hypothetical protein
MAQLNRWAQMMHNKINQRRGELQMKLNQMHQQIEMNSGHWKAFLTNQMEIKVQCVLKEQSQKDEVDGSAFEKVQDDFSRLEELFHVLNSQPLISVSTVEDNQVDLSVPYIDFPAMIVDSFGWIEDGSTENTVETMEYSDPQQNDVDESNTDRRDTCKYAED